MTRTSSIPGILLRRFLLFSIVLIAASVVQSPVLLLAAEGDYSWAGAMGGSLDDIGYHVAVDSSGNVYTTGYFQGTVDFDPGPGTSTLTSAGFNDIFITKMSREGRLVWARSIGGVSDDEGYGIAVDSSGNVYTTGYFVGTVDFDPGAGSFPLDSAGSSDIFISKLDSSGNFAGAWAMGGNNADYGFGIFVDAAGGIYTTCYFRNTADFDPGPANEPLVSAGVEDIFLSKLGSDGSYTWARRIGGAGADVGLGLSKVSAGNLYVTGWFQGSVDFDPDPVGEDIHISSGGTYDIFVCKLTGSGNLAWARSMGGVSEDIGQAVAVDSQGSVFVTGWFNETVDFDPGPGTFPITSTGSADIFVSKLDSSGNFAWAGAMGGTTADVGYGIALDSRGNVYTTGSFQGSNVDFDPGDAAFPLSSAGNEDIFISKLSNSGSFVWARSMGGASVDRGYGIAVDSSAAVHATGFFQGTADLDPGAGKADLVSAGFEDIFILKLEGQSSFPWNLYLPAITGNSQGQP